MENVLPICSPAGKAIDFKKPGRPEARGGVFQAVVLPGLSFCLWPVPENGINISVTADDGRIHSPLKANA
jgi:hypothetical protein